MLPAKYRTFTSTGKRSGTSFPGVIAFHATGLEAVRSPFNFMNLLLLVLGTLNIAVLIWDFSRKKHADYPLALRNFRRSIIATAMVMLIVLYQMFIGF
jgi:hypothetical protein